MTERRHTVSVVIPTYNDVRFLPAAIHSVLEQTQPVDEVIVVDDGSSNDTLALLTGFEDAIRIARHERNLGLPAARNTGIRMASGTLIAFLDSDDTWLPSMVEKQTEEFSKHRDLGLCYTSLIDCDSDLRPWGQPWPSRRRSSEHVFEELYMTAFPMPPSTVFVRREVFDRTGLFDERMIKKQDFECWLRIAMLYPVSCIPEPLCLRRVHAEALTRAKKGHENVYYEDRCFEFCGAAAQRFGIALPMPVAQRQALSHRRRLFETLGYGDLKTARGYRAAVLRDGPLSMADHLRISLLTLRAHLQAAVHTMRRVAGRTCPYSCGNCVPATAGGGYSDTSVSG